MSAIPSTEPVLVRPALQVVGLRKSYGGSVAIDDVSFEVSTGTVLGFLGPNGAGKTTAIRILSTILAPDQGSFTVAGVPHTRPSEIRRRIGVLPESAGYPPGQTGQEWLSFHAELFGRSRRDARDAARRLLDEVGLADRGGSLVAGYSRGMRQRLGIARALVNDPRVIFLDEPTLGLDPSGQAQVLDLIVGVARTHGVTVLLSTHSLDDVEQVCDDVLILNRGRVVARGTVEEVVRQAAGPRRGLVKVPPELQARAVDLVNGNASGVTAAAGTYRGEVELGLPPGMGTEATATRALETLLDADVPVLAFTMEGGRLSEAFLALTGDH